MFSQFGLLDPLETSACLGPVSSAWHKFGGFEATMRKYEYELIGFRPAFCFVNISVPKYRT